MEDNKIVIYQTPDGQTELDVRLQEETVWLNAEQMATLFDRDTKTIRKHINNAIKEELADVVVVAKFATTTQHGAIAGKEVKMDVFRYALQTCRICSTHLPRDKNKMHRLTADYPTSSPNPTNWKTKSASNCTILDTK